MGRIISVREYDLKPGINIGSRTHSRDTEARGLLQLPGLVAQRRNSLIEGHHARTSYFIVVTCVLRFGLVTGGFSAAAPDPQEPSRYSVGQRRVVIRDEKSMVDRAVQSIQPELPSGLYARQR